MIHSGKRTAPGLAFAAVVLLASLALGVACSSEDPTTTICTGVMVAGVCQKSCSPELCQAGHECFNNTCSAPCTSHNNCDGNRYCIGISKSTGGTGTFCVCLTEVVNGQCQDQAPTCDEAACPPGWKCLAGACRPPCTTHADCPVGKNCLHAVIGGGVEGDFCGPTSFNQDGGSGQSTPCTSDTDCDVGRGWHCSAGTCRVRCSVHADCGTLGACSGVGKDANGKTIGWCEPDSLPRGPGQFGTSCSEGPEQCDQAGGFTCVGAPGDLDAYCTKKRCAGDNECPSGLYCADELTNRPPCESACNFTPMPADRSCIPATDIGDGKDFHCGPLGIIQTLCLKREFCSPCETDADCRGIQNQICAKDTGGNKICTVTCDPAVNSCPWEGAGGCGLTDTEVGVPTCSHRFGSCKGTGKNCEPCVDQNDCKAQGACITNRFSTERFCIDLEASCSGCSGPGVCPGAGCAATPSGLPGLCNENPGSPAHRKCFGANASSNPLGGLRLGCWQPT